MSVISRRIFVATSVAAVLSAVAPIYGQTPQSGLPSRNQLSRFGLERAWSNQATIDVRSDVVRHLVADEEVVIVQTRSGLVTVFDAQSGVKLWDAQLSRVNEYSFPAVTNGDVMFVVIGSTVYARDKFRGNELWTLELPSVPSTSPTVDDQRMYVGMLAGDVYAFDLKTIARNQAEGRLPQFNYENIVWRYATSGRIVVAPVTDGKIVCFANALGSLYAVAAAERDLRFQFETRDEASAPLEMQTAVENGIPVSFVFLASGDTNLYCLRVTNGTTRWLHVAGAPIREKPHVIDDSLYLVPLDAGIFDLAVDTGRQRWWSPVVTSFVAATPTRLFGTDRAGNLAVLDRGDGAVLGTLPMSGFPIRFQNERTDRIYACSTSGLVTCIREQGAELPIYHRYPERRPILPLFGDQPMEEAGATGEGVKAELDATIQEAIQLLEAGDLVAFTRRFTPPDDLQRMTQATSLDQVSDAQISASLEKGAPTAADKERLRTQLLESMTLAQKIEPEIAADGQRAEYDITRGFRTMVLFKLSDKWYLTSGNARSIMSR